MAFLSGGESPSLFSPRQRPTPTAVGRPAPGGFSPVGGNAAGGGVAPVPSPFGGQSPTFAPYTGTANSGYGGPIFGSQPHPPDTNPTVPGGGGPAGPPGSGNGQPNTPVTGFQGPSNLGQAAGNNALTMADQVENDTRGGKNKLRGNHR